MPLEAAFPTAERAKKADLRIRTIGSGETYYYYLQSICGLNAG